MDPEKLAVYGPLGIMCGWFMFRVESALAKLLDRQSRLEAATKSLANSNALRLLKDPEFPHAAHPLAQQIIDDTRPDSPTTP